MNAWKPGPHANSGSNPRNDGVSPTGHSRAMSRCERRRPVCIRRRLGYCVLAACSAALAARAEMEDREYAPTEAVGSTQILQQRRIEIEIETREAARREAEARAAEAATRHARVAQRAARLHAEQLMEARCETACHGYGRLAANRHTWLGWQAVIVRMRWLNGAPLSQAESNVLARHLAERQGVRGLAAWLEWAGLTLMAPALPALSWLGWRWFRRPR